jgi:hypothetical protein
MKQTSYDRYIDIHVDTPVILNHSIFSTTLTNCHIYSLLPLDDGLLASPKHVEV